VALVMQAQCTWIGAGVVPRDGGADCRGDHDVVRPTEILAHLHGG
jgi:hypothetical protein